MSLKIGPACCSTKVSILKTRTGRTWSPTSFSTTGGFIDTKTLTVAGTYTIFVDPQAAVVGSVTLTLYNVPGRSERADRPGGPAVAVTTTTPGQNAKLTFDGTAGQRVASVNMASVTISKSTVSILKPDGTTLVSMANSGGFMAPKLTPGRRPLHDFVRPAGNGDRKKTLSLDVPA